MTSGPSLYYTEFGSYDCQTNFHLIKPLKEIKKINKKLRLLVFVKLNSIQIIAIDFEYF